MAQKSNVPRSQEDYITQVSEKIEGTVTKKLSQEFSRTKNRIIGTLSSLQNLLMNPPIQGDSGTAAETSRNALGTNEGTNEDDCQSDPHPEAGIFHNQMMRRRWFRQLDRNSWGSHVLFSQYIYRKAERNRSTSQSHIRRWQATTILHPFIIKSTEFVKCQNRSPQRCQHLTGNLGSSSCLKIFSKRALKFIISGRKMTESANSILSWGKMRYKHLKTLLLEPRENLREILEVFQRKYVKPKSMATTKHKFQKLDFNPAKI